MLSCGEMVSPLLLLLALAPFFLFLRCGFRRGGVGCGEDCEGGLWGEGFEVELGLGLR